MKYDATMFCSFIMAIMFSKFISVLKANINSSKNTFLKIIILIHKLEQIFISYTFYHLLLKMYGKFEILFTSYSSSLGVYVLFHCK